jgi:hypothetical protein
MNAKTNDCRPWLERDQGAVQKESVSSPDLTDPEFKALDAKTPKADAEVTCQSFGRALFVRSCALAV